MNILRLRERTTRDVDVIAISKSAGSDAPRFELTEQWSESFQALVYQVARDLKLPLTDTEDGPLDPDRKWLNLGPRLLFKQGLPDGMIDRAQQRSCGPRLSVFFAGRQDLIAFKICASLTSDRSAVHILDLFHLNPTLDEMRTALHWVASRPMLPETRSKRLPDLLRTLEYGQLIPEFCA